ncbi:MAG: sugar phosphate isomerase/epimerase family protein [bacterium]
MKSTVLIQPEFKEFQQYLDFAGQHQLKFEIVDFAYPDILDETVLCTERINFYLQYKQLITSMHGVFLDIHPESMDSKIKKVSRERILQNLEIAQKLECRYIVFHTSFNPLINHPRYIENWMEQQVNCWEQLISDRDITVVLENVFEYSPRYLHQLLKKVNLSNLGWCLDSGHINLYSQASLEEWLQLLGNKLYYVHLNDNDGKSDQHLPCGHGKINWKQYDSLIRKLNINPVTVLETSGIEQISKSRRFLIEQGIIS